MAPHGNRTRGSVVAVGVICAFLVAIPRVARADIEDAPSKTDAPSSAQVEDTDRPKDSILDKKPADAAVASKKAEAPAGPPFWEKWQFWAVAGGIVAAGVIAVIAVPKIAHQINGGDVRPCAMMFQNRCFGEGR